MTTEDESKESGGGSFVERFISRFEIFGLNAARFILAATITIAIILFVIGAVKLGAEGIHYARATGDGKYQIASISYSPNFSNVSLNGKAQANADSPVTEDRLAASSTSRDQLIADRLAYMNEAGLCIGAEGGQCPDLERQRDLLASEWQTISVHAAISNDSGVSYRHSPSFSDFSNYYGAYGFGSEGDALKAEWGAVNNCLTAYKDKNGNLYFQKAPQLFDAIVAECDADYGSAIQAELNSRPKDWTVIDSARVYFLISGVAGLGVTIIMIAMTIVFFRLEVSFRALRYLKRLK